MEKSIQLKNRNNDNIYPIGILKEYVLYNSTSGTNGTVNLSDSVANYKYLKIFFRTNDSINNKSSQEIYSPNGAKTTLSYPAVGNNGTNVYYKFKSIIISGTTIQNEATNRYVEGDWTGSTISKLNYIYITRVVGYK